MLYHKRAMKRDLIFAGGVLAVYGGAILIHHPIGCLIQRFTGIPCPTCGMSSSLYHAAHFNFEAAIYFHPLFFTLPFIAAYYMYESYLRPTKSKYFNPIMIAMIILFISVYIIRMIWFRETIV